MRRAARGFTLIELVAVVALVALVAAIVLPRIGIGGDRRTMAEAEKLAASLEYARESAVVTGTPHRVRMDLDRQTWRIEILAPEPPEQGEESRFAPGLGDAGEAALHPADRNWATAERLPLAPPRDGERVWQPLEGPLGTPTPLPDDVAMVAVETADARAERGVLAARFGPDGSGEATWIEVADVEGNRVTLEVAPLADRVRLAWGGLRRVRGG